MGYAFILQYSIYLTRTDDPLTSEKSHFQIFQIKVPTKNKIKFQLINFLEDEKIKTLGMVF